MSKRWAEISPDAVYEEVQGPLHRRRYRVNFLGTEVHVQQEGNVSDVTMYRLSPSQLFHLVQQWHEKGRPAL